MEKSVGFHRSCDNVNVSRVVEYKSLISDIKFNEKSSEKCQDQNIDQHQLKCQQNDLYKNSIKFSAALPQVNNMCVNAFIDQSNNCIQKYKCKLHSKLFSCKSHFFQRLNL